MGKSRQSANLVSDNNIFVNIINDRVGVGSTTPKVKLDVIGDVNVSGVITASSFSGNVQYASTSGIATYASTAGIATTSTNATVSFGLSGTPNINVGNITGTAATFTNLTVTGQSVTNRVAISTVGINTTLETGRVYVYLSGVTSLTLPSSPTTGDTLKIINRSGITTALILRNGSNIMGSASDLQFDELDTGYTFTYINSNEGWTLG